MAIQQEKTLLDVDISIVIPTLNRPHLATALSKQIRSLHPSVQIIVIEGVPNTSIAKNRGIEKATGKIIFFFDDDVELTKETIPQHLKMYAGPQVVGVSGRVINDGEVIPDQTDVETGKTNPLGTKFIWQYWSTKEQSVDFAYGCNMSYRRTVLEKVRFDPVFPKIFEEIDLGVNITRRHGKIIFAPDALVYHHKAPTGGARTDAGNELTIIYSHYGTYLAKNVSFPLSLLSMVLRTRTALREAPWALFSLWNHYIRYLLFHR